MDDKKDSSGTIWVYRKQPIVLPASSTFSTTLTFGSPGIPTLEEVYGKIERVLAGEDADKVCAEPPPAQTVMRTVMLGYYKSLVEVG